VTADPQSNAPPLSAPIGAGVSVTAQRLRGRTLVAALLGLAIALGGWLRLDAIGAREMSADEGASWAAAAAPSLAGVVRIQAALNPGKLAVYEVALHGWMRLFGDGLGAMRTLSAIFDTFSIVVVFMLVRELLGTRPNQDAVPGATPYAGAEAVAALAALLFAVNLVTIKYARELRMYPLALLIVLLQVWIFVRLVRRGPALFALALLALLTALAVATHFSAAFMFFAEALFLAAAPLIWPRGEQYPTAAVLAIGGAFAAGAALFLLVALPDLHSGAQAFANGATGWIERPRWWAPLSLFNKGVGSVAFPAMAALAGWGAWRGWARAREAAAFALAWMWLPPLLLLAASYGFSPMFVERYALWCFVPFFMLAALGAWEIPGAAARPLAIVVAVCLALAHLHAYARRPHDTQWREAARAAAGALAPGEKIAVAPPYAVNAVRYYLRGMDGAAAVPMDDAGARGGAAGVLIIGDQWNAHAEVAKLRQGYPRPVAALRDVRVCGRAAPAR
jgi:4-amino-4-deoxy-L-arabinose transferase-like glycosyltransferase